jgi:hypothetical protein
MGKIIEDYTQYNSMIKNDDAKTLKKQREIACFFLRTFHDEHLFCFYR